jgi:hypothetical protein
LSDDWVIGFSEGEGCFGVYSKRAKKTSLFCITQKEKEILDEIKSFFGFGNVCYDNHVWRYQVRRYGDQLILKDFFEGRLRSETKRIQFERWKIALEKWGERFIEHGRPWTEEEIETAKTMRGRGYTQKQIAKAINRTWRGVEAKLAEIKHISASGVEA